MSIVLDLRSNNTNAHNFTTNFDNHIELDPESDYEVGLLDAVIFNSNPNTVSKYFKWRADALDDWITVNVTDGIYDHNAYNTILKTSLEANSGFTISSGVITYAVQIVPNYNVGKVEIKINTAGYEFNTGNMGILLGSDDNTTIYETTILGNTPNLSINGTQIYILCNLVNPKSSYTTIGSTYTSAIQTNLLYSSPITSAAYDSLKIEPMKPLYLSISSKSITSVTIKLVNEYNQPYYTPGEISQFTIEIRKVRK